MRSTERRKFSSYQANVAEVYSLRRVCAPALKLGLKDGFVVGVNVNNKHGEPWDLPIEKIQLKNLRKRGATQQNKAEML